MTKIGNSTVDSGINLARFVPIPNHASKVNFGQVLGTVGNIAKTAIGGAASVVTGSNNVSIDPVYQNFLEKQIYVQEQMLQVSLVSNIEKTAHDTKMTAVRNIRAS